MLVNLTHAEGDIMGGGQFMHREVQRKTINNFFKNRIYSYL